MRLSAGFLASAGMSHDFPLLLAFFIFPALQRAETLLSVMPHFAAASFTDIMSDIIVIRPLMLDMYVIAISERSVIIVIKIRNNVNFIRNNI